MCSSVPGADAEFLQNQTTRRTAIPGTGEFSIERNECHRQSKQNTAIGVRLSSSIWRHDSLNQSRKVQGRRLWRWNAEAFRHHHFEEWDQLRRLCASANPDKVAPVDLNLAQD